MEDLNKIPPTMSKAGKKMPFKVPEDYFENFSIRLSNRIHEKKSPEIVGRLIPVLRPYFAIAVVTVIILVAVRIFIIHPGKSDMNDLKGYEITASVEANLYYYSEEAIIEAAYPVSESSTPEEDVTEEEIIEYLINEDISLNDILNAI